MEKIIKVKTPLTGKVDTYFIAGDWHDLHCHIPSVNIMLKAALEVPKKYRKLIINGDFVDLPEFMSRTLNKRKHTDVVADIEGYYLPAMDYAVEWAENMLDKLEKVFYPHNIIFGFGNHDKRADYFIDQYAPKKYHDDFNLKKRLRIKERGYKFYDYNDWLDIGHLSITHGMYHGTTCVKKHYEASGTNVIFSHVHSKELKTFVRRGHTVMSASLPCMCSLAPEYIRGRENNWSNGFGIINMKSNGNFNFYIVDVWDNEAVLPNGKIIKG